MRTLAKILTVLSLGLLPVVAWFAWPRAPLIVMCALLAVPLTTAMVAYVFERRWLRWLGFAANLAFAAIMLFAFTFMLLHVPAPPNLVETLPVLLAALVLLVTPAANSYALRPARL